MKLRGIMCASTLAGCKWQKLQKGLVFIIVTLADRQKLGGYTNCSDNWSYSNRESLILDGRARVSPVIFAAMMPPRNPITVVKLADNFGQYVLILTCSACGHHRIAQPRTLAGLAGWDANLEDVVKRLRCSQCGKRKCTAAVRPETKRDG